MKNRNFCSNRPPRYIAGVWITSVNRRNRRHIARKITNPLPDCPECASCESPGGGRCGFVRIKSEIPIILRNVINDVVTARLRASRNLFEEQGAGGMASAVNRGRERQRRWTDTTKKGQFWGKNIARILYLPFSIRGEVFIGGKRLSTRLLHGKLIEVVSFSLFIPPFTIWWKIWGWKYIIANKVPHTTFANMYKLYKLKSTGVTQLKYYY